MTFSSHNFIGKRQTKNAADFQRIRQQQKNYGIHCNWLPFERPCSFASQAFACFADSYSYYSLFYLTTLYGRTIRMSTNKSHSIRGIIFQFLSVLDLFYPISDCYLGSCQSPVYCCMLPRIFLRAVRSSCVFYLFHLLL